MRRIIALLIVVMTIVVACIWSFGALDDRYIAILIAILGISMIAVIDIPSLLDRRKSR